LRAGSTLPTTRRHAGKEASTIRVPIIFRRLTLLIVAVATLALAFAGTASAIVQVTTGNGGTNIVADKAANGPTPTWTPLTDIVITEITNNEFPLNQTNRTVILTPPSNWEFNTSSGSASFAAGGNVTAASLTVASSTLTLTLSTNIAAAKKDIVTITGVQVRPLDATAGASNGNIVRTAGNFPAINGIANNVTSFGALSMTPDTTPPGPFSITPPAGGAPIKNGYVLQSNPNDPTPSSGLASVQYFFCPAFSGCAVIRTSIGSSASSPSYPFTWSGQPADGTYELVAVATDKVGRTTESPVVPITVDNTPPNTTLTSTPPDPSNGSPSLAFSSDEGGTFECSLDGAPFAACSSPDSLSGLASGSHIFQVRAVDLAGNPDATPASDTWTVDATAPTTSFSSTPSNPSSSASAGFAFSANESAAFECRLDAAAFAACTSPTNLTSLADGSHTFDVRGTDGVGNVGGAATFTWTIDTITPVVTLTSTPSNPSGSASASLSFNVSEPTTVECSLDAAPYAACSSPQSLTGLADGSHTFAVRATDSVSHVGSATYTWTVDTVTPTVSFTSTPPSTSTSKSASFSFSVSEPATIECGLDGGAFAACTSPRNLNDLPDGTHTFEVHATDGVGHVGSATYTWTVDTVTPVVSFGSTPPNPTNAGAATFSFSANEAATLECRLDGGAYAACSSPDSVNVADGSHTFTVRATDAAGHAGTASFSWSVDTVTPKTPSLAAPAAAAATRSLRLAAVYTDPEPGSSGYVEFRVCTDPNCTNVVASGSSEQVARGATAAWSIDVALADATYYWQARSVDVAGNASGWSTAWNFTRDTTIPAAPGGFVGVVAGDGLTLRWTAPPGDDQIGNYVVFVNGKLWRVLGEVTYEAKLGPFDAGDARSFSVAAVDRAGNEGPQTTALVGVPDLVGLSLTAAKDAVATRGLVLDDKTVAAEALPAFVVSQTPPAPSLAQRGSGVAVVLGAVPTMGDRPLVEIDGGRVCGVGGFLYLQVRLRERAKVSVSVFDTRFKRLALRRLGSRPPGLTSHSLHLPKALGRPGRYRVVVTAKASHRSGRDAMSITVKRPSRRGGARTGC
jgi:hypothetical protein